MTSADITMMIPCVYCGMQSYTTALLRCRFNKRSNGDNLSAAKENNCLEADRGHI